MEYQEAVEKRCLSSTMNRYDIPYFVIKRNLQKSKNTGVYFSDLMTAEVLRDVCFRITGKYQYNVDFVENDYSDDFLPNTYNKGRLAILHYHDVVSYITFSELEVHGRNSSVQSVPTAFNLFYLNPYPNKKLYYYFLNVQAGNPETDYLIMMYRLMNTIGFHFLNASPDLLSRIQPFASIDDIMFNRRISSGRNQSNNATYITKDGANTIEIYGKVYGASKYETSMMCYALSLLASYPQTVTLYEVLEQDLRELPEVSRQVIRHMGIIDIVPTDMTLEKRLFYENDSLRSPRYIFNLLDHIGPKKCVMCECGIPELIQGAHIWPVASIKQERTMSFEDKLKCATDGHNGLWLCENHHKLFDENIIVIQDSGEIQYRNDLPRDQIDYIIDITPNSFIPDQLMTDRFCDYLWRRNRMLAV